jgi:arylsulfatase A-like enzyme
LSFLEHRTDAEKEQPFFSYLAFTAPHWPLQAPPEVVRKYCGWYDDGPLALRRLKSFIKLSLVSEDVEPASLHTMGTKSWEEFGQEERQKSARAIEIFAAMVDLIDVNVGRVYSYLESTGELDNTLIVFMSDNGVEGHLLEAIPVLAGATLGDVIKQYCDNSL